MADPLLDSFQPLEAGAVVSADRGKFADLLAYPIFLHPSPEPQEVFGAADLGGGS